MDSYTDTYQGNDDFYNNLLSQGVDLVAGAGYIAYNVLTAATLATTASFAGVALFKGPKKAFSYFDRYITFPMERKSRKIRSCWARKTGTNCISKVVDAIFPCYNKANKATFDRFINHFDNAYNSYTEVRDQCQLLNSRIRQDFQGVPVGFNANETRNVNINAIVNEFQRLKDEVIAAHRGVITSITDMNNIIVETINFCENHGFKNSQGYYKMQYNLQENSHRLRSVQAELNHYSNMNILEQATQTYERLSILLEVSNWGNEDNSVINNEANSEIYLNIDRKILNADPKFYLKEFLRKSMEADNFRFSIIGENAVDQGGVRREVYTTLFRSLLEEEGGSFRSILDLGEDIDVYKGLGVALSKVANDMSLFLINYFDRDLFTIIATLSVDELALLRRGDDGRGIELIKQRLILVLNKGPSTEQLTSIFKFKNLEVKTDEDFKQIEELLVDVLGCDEDELEELKNSKPEEYKAFIEKEIDTWFKENQHFYIQADKLIAIAMYFNRAGSLDNIVAPLDKEILATATIESENLIDLNVQSIACVRKKIELIHDWIRTEATPEQLHQFIQFCTGASVLIASNPIKIDHGTHPFFAHTCFNTLSLSTTFEQRDDPENTTEEQVYAAFIRDLERVILPTSGANFNAI